MQILVLISYFLFSLSPLLRKIGLINDTIFGFSTIFSYLFLIYITFYILSNYKFPNKKLIVKYNIINLTMLIFAGSFSILFAFVHDRSFSFLFAMFFTFFDDLFVLFSISCRGSGSKLCKTFPSQ